MRRAKRSPTNNEEGLPADPFPSSIPYEDDDGMKGRNNKRRDGMGGIATTSGCRTFLVVVAVALVGLLFWFRILRMDDDDNALSFPMSVSDAAAAAAATTASGVQMIYNNLCKINDTVIIKHVGADAIWEMLLAESAHQRNMMKKGNDNDVVIEVGMYSPYQCRLAAEYGLEAHCIEASPKNYKSLNKKLAGVGKDPAVRARMHIQNKAAGPLSGQQVPFTTSGSTGDHVGAADAWEMAKIDNINQTTTAHNNNNDNHKQVVQVETLAVDDLIDAIGRPIYVAKIDTQGYEPQVFAGMQKSIQNHAIQHILMEFWPRGMDLMSSTSSSSNGAGGSGTPPITPPCTAGSQILHELYTANYTLYHASVVAHPMAGRRRVYRNQEGDRPLRPQPASLPRSSSSSTLSFFQDYCQWYLDLEQRIPNPDYKMGYWTDILAVAPYINGTRRLPRSWSSSWLLPLPPVPPPPFPLEGGGGDGGTTNHQESTSKGISSSEPLTRVAQVVGLMV